MTTDELTTTRQRRWALWWGLSLPWLICWGLLWTVTEVTPDPSVYYLSVNGIASRSVGPDLTGPAVGFERRNGVSAPKPETLGGLRRLHVSWNEGRVREALYPADPRSRIRWQPPFESLSEPEGSEALGALWKTGGGAGGRYLLATVSLLWLLPFPLLWSGFNLWRWVRGGRRTTAESPGSPIRRTWRLIGALALPWGVCLGLLGLLVGLTPDPTPGYGPQRGLETTGLAARLLTDRWPGHPLSVYLCWNVREQYRRLFDKSPGAAPPIDEDLTQWPRAGVLWSPPSGPPPRTAGLVLSLWWLLPVPLLWSGFNLWRGVRRGSDP
ncbi:hypothetical protein [Alienimonas sp. DA493]|uniref:hypothetical protein n=1 Tax=Alienimonas sp. DA493 TaxID=3373605 RepID=UPI0037545C74